MQRPLAVVVVMVELVEIYKTGKIKSKDKKQGSIEPDEKGDKSRSFTFIPKYRYFDDKTVRLSFNPEGIPLKALPLTVTARALEVQA